jgi:DNA repair protein RecO (recombination protein O)
MSIKNTSAIILNVSPYRETSCILKLFSLEYGLITGIAKGIKRLKTRREPLERGSLVNLTVYLKQNREINTVSDFQINNFYPSIRKNLHKTTIRDIVFELILASTINFSPQSKLYFCLINFLSQLEQFSEKQALFIILWRFFYRYTVLSGFGPDFSQCICCKEPLKDNGFLLINKGGILCQNCSKNSIQSNEIFIPELLFSILSSKDFQYDKKTFFDSTELLRITRLAISYCRYHLDIHREFKSFNFLEQLILF